MNNKLCVILNTAPHYRKAIYKVIDEAFDCDWYVGDRVEDIKTLSPKELKNCTVVKNIKVYKKNYIQKGLLKLLFKHKYSRFLITGDIRNISVWCFLLLARLFRRKRVYIWTHGFNGKGGRIARLFKRLFASLSDGIFLYGDYARENMIASGINPKRLFVIHNSLDYEAHLKCRQNLRLTNLYREHFGNDNKNLIFIGRLTSVKRLDLLLDAVRILRDRGTLCNVTFIGDGAERETLERMTAAYNLQDLVWFYGASYDEQRNGELIYNADLCVSPGNVGLTAIHSLVFGTPVATHNNFQMQMPEFEAVKEGVTGTYFNYHDSHSIADTIEGWFIQHGEDRETIRKNCMQEIDTNWTPQFQIDVLTKNLV